MTPTDYSSFASNLNEPLRIRLVTQQQARHIIEWRYPPPYDIYTIAQEGDGEPEVAKHVEYLMNSATNCHTIVDRHEELIAFCTFGKDAQVPGGEYSSSALDIGLGVHPDLIGRGHGSEIVAHVLSYALQTFAQSQYRVTIAAFNVRAQRVWQNNGFHDVFQGDIEISKYILVPK